MIFKRNAIPPDVGVAIATIPSVSTDLPRCSAFLKDPRPRRIDWLGDLAFPDPMLRRRQPSIFVHLSLVDTPALADPTLLLRPESTFHGRFQQGCWVSVGMLPLLRIGDLWSEGRLLQQPDYEVEIFPDVEITEETTTLVKAGLNKDSSGFLLPLNEHPWHRRCTHSYCVEVALDDRRRLLVPCMELIRFYFGSSSKLINRLFTPPLTSDALYVAEEFDHSTGRLHLTLAETMSGASASDIGRICLDPLAWRAAKLIGSSLLKETADAQAHFPQAVFPFEGSTTLSAAGKWLSFGGLERSTFVVFNLRSCSHPFPFKSLRYEIQQAPTSSPMVRPPNAFGSFDHRLPRRCATRPNGEETFVEQDASRRLGMRIRSVPTEPRFPDLLRKPVWKQKALADGALGSYSGATEVGQVTVGEANAEHRIRAVDLVIAIVSLQTPPEFLRATIARLKRLRRLQPTLLTSSEHDGWTVPITMVHDANGEIAPRLFIEAEGRKSRLRRISAFRLWAKNRQYCLLLIEADPAHKQRYTVSAADDIWQSIGRATNDFLDL